MDTYPINDFAMYKGLLSVLILEQMMNNEHRRYSKVKGLAGVEYLVNNPMDSLDQMPLFEDKAPLEDLNHKIELEHAFQYALEMHWNSTDCTINSLRKQAFSEPMAKRLAAIARYVGPIEDKKWLVDTVEYQPTDHLE